MSSFTNVLEEMVDLASNSSLGSLPVDVIHRALFYSFAKAGLSLLNVADTRRAELEKVARTIPPSIRGLVEGELYLSALKLLRSFRDSLLEAKKPVVLEEASLRYLINFLKERVERVDGVVVLDCGSIPEFVSLAWRFTYMNRSVVIYDRVFVNPVGATKFLTDQLAYLGRKPTLEEYAQLLRRELGAQSSIKISSIDLSVHRHGVSIDEFLESLNMKEIFECIDSFSKHRAVLVTADHGYDMVVDEFGVYVTHGYRGVCPLNFSRVALFLVID